MKILIAFLAIAGAVLGQSLGAGIQQPSTGGGGAVASVTGAGSVTCTPTTGAVVCTGTGGGVGTFPTSIFSVSGSTASYATSQTANQIIGTNGSGTVGLYSPATVLGYTPANIASPAFTGTPTAPTQTTGDATTALATDAFVANAVTASNPAVAVLAASAGANISGTYSNGTAGIGATFTVTATGAFTLDGVAINTIGQRVLLKDQTSGFQNGVYTATVVGAVAVSPIFTRALDYDMPSDMNSTGAIPVQSGSVNATTSWLLTSTVNTVGTDALTYVQFSYAPSTLCSLTKYTIAYNDSALNVASAVPTKTIATLAGTSTRICLVEISGTTSFAGTSLTAATVRLQSGAGTPLFYSPNQDIFGTVGPTTNNYWTDAGNTADRTNQSVVAAFTLTGANGSALTAGSVSITVGVRTVP